METVNQYSNHKSHKSDQDKIKGKKETYDSLIIINNNNNNNNLKDDLFTPEEILTFLNEHKDLSVEELRNPERIENYFRRDNIDIKNHLLSAQNLSMR